MVGSYNGMPLFSVGEDDFMYIIECKECDKRLLSKNIVCDELRDYYVNARKPAFSVSYGDVIISYAPAKEG